MKTRRAVVVFAFVTVAALSFAAGRATLTAPALAFNPETPSGSVTQLATATTTERPAGISIESVDQVATANFDDAYRAMKAATPDTIRRWAKDLEAIKVRPTRQAAMRSFFRTLMQLDPAEARRLIVGLDEENRRLALMAVKNAAPPRAMKEVLEIMLSFQRGELSGCGFDLVGDAMDDWCKTDPASVKQFIDAHPAAELDLYSGALVRNWAAYDPDAGRELVDAAIARANAYGAEPNEAELLSDRAGQMATAWVEGFLEHDRAAALDYVLTTDHESVANALPTVFAALFKESPDEARAFLQRLSPAQQSRATSGVAYVVDRFVYGDADDAVRSPEFIAEWLLEFPPEVWRDSISNAIGPWKEKDSPALFAWMSNLPAATKSQVAAAYQPYFGVDGVENEFAKLMSIADLELRDQLLEQVVAESNYFRAPVVAALAAADLPTEQKTRLTALIPELPRVSDESDEE